LTNPLIRRRPAALRLSAECPLKNAALTAHASLQETMPFLTAHRSLKQQTETSVLTSCLSPQGFRTVAISRGQEKKEEALKLGAHVYIDTKTQDAAKELQVGTS
jgi:hypothetical protein